MSKLVKIEAITKYSEYIEFPFFQRVTWQGNAGIQVFCHINGQIISYVVTPKGFDALHPNQCTPEICIRAWRNLTKGSRSNRTEFMYEVMKVQRRNISKMLDGE